MCYSAASSLRTSVVSALAIVYLLSSGTKHYQWLGVILIGWCGMQFAEYLLWRTDPQKKCTATNQTITLTLIPLVLMLQPLGALYGSLFVIPWDKSTLLRKQFIVGYTILIVLLVLVHTFFRPQKTCTIVTDQYHLHWLTREIPNSSIRTAVYLLWAALVAIPLYFYWTKRVLMTFLLVTPILGFIYGAFTDSAGSLWCYYTSYSSVIAAAALAAKQLGFGDIMEVKWW